MPLSTSNSSLASPVRTVVPSSPGPEAKPVSNSKLRAPQAHWGRTWLLACVLVAGILGGEEWLFRARGHVPSVIDDEMLWACQRAKVYSSTKIPVAVLGDSRMQLDFIPSVFNVSHPQYEAVQLAVDGKTPWAALKDLAQDPNFKGIVLCGMSDQAFVRAGSRVGQEPHVKTYHRYVESWLGLDKRMNREVATWMQSRLAVANPLLSPVSLLRIGYEHQSLPNPVYAPLHADRSRPADYSKSWLENQRAKRLQGIASLRPLPPAIWLEHARDIEPLVQAIQNRGGQVILIHSLTSGPLLEREQKAYPKTEYWDKLAAVSSAKMIHFADLPEFRKFVCPDYSHLDCRDAPQFTLDLADELTRRGVFQGNSQLSSPAAASAADKAFPVGEEE